MALGGETKWLKRQQREEFTGSGYNPFLIILVVVIIASGVIWFTIDGIHHDKTQPKVVPSESQSTIDFNGPKTDDNGVPTPEYLEYLKQQEQKKAYDEMIREEMQYTLIEEDMDNAEEYNNGAPY